MEVSHWRRFCAALLDLMFFSLISLPAVLIVVSVYLYPQVSQGSLVITDDLYLLVSVRIFVVYCVVYWMYFALSESSRFQATFGKRILKLQIASVTGSKVGFWKATWRSLSKVFSSFFLIGFIMILFTKENKSLHDLMSRTQVSLSTKKT